MTKFYVIGIVIAVALIIFTFVDIALTESRRIRGVPKGFWFFIALIPLLGIVLWFAVGKEPARTATYLAPDDDPSFLKTIRRDDEQDERIRQLEQELAELDSDASDSGDDSDDPKRRP